MARSTLKGYSLWPLPSRAAADVGLAASFCRIQSLFVATRALLLRRRLHRAWAATGYSDTFFENNPTIAALHGVQGWGAGGWGATQVRKREKKLGKRPTMWEVELPEDEAAAAALAEKEAMVSDSPSSFASSSTGSGEWEKLQVRARGWILLKDARSDPFPISAPAADIGPHPVKRRGSGALGACRARRKARPSFADVHADASRPTRPTAGAAGLLRAG